MCLALQLGLSERELKVWPLASTQEHADRCLDPDGCSMESVPSQTLYCLVQVLSVGVQQAKCSLKLQKKFCRNLAEKQFPFHFTYIGVSATIRKNKINNFEWGRGKKCE